MSEIEKMRRYIEKYKVPRTPRYDASINEIIAIASEMSPMEAANFAFVYGRAKGYRAGKAEGGEDGMTLEEEKNRYPNLWRVAQELARCKYPEKVFNALTVLLSEEPEILREEAEV